MQSLGSPPLAPTFYERDAEIVAPKLLGKILVARENDGVAASTIVEVEAYLGKQDPASHAFRGVRRLNTSMFESGGTCYVYLSYGINYCMDVITGCACDG